MEMEINLYVKHMKTFYGSFLNFIENNDDYESDNLLQKLLDHIDFTNNRYIQELIILISKIAKNHHFDNIFFQNIKKVILCLSDYIKMYFTNFQIFDIFKENKRIILFLLKNQIIKIDHTILDFIYSSLDDECNKINSNLYNYDIFLYPEIKDYLDIETCEFIENKAKTLDSSIFELFDEKREKGENDNYLYELIRSDSVEDFIKYVNKKSISLNSVIKPSVFETNLMLIKKNATLIEYAAFFGSIQIFQYLKYSNAELNPSLWIYAIHSNNADMIHLLEDYQVDPPKYSYAYCLKCAIKCHHNDIAHYILDNILSKNEISKIKRNDNENIILYSLQSKNYEFYVDGIADNVTFLCLCRCNQIELVKLFLKYKNIDVNYMILDDNSIKILKIKSNSNIL